MDYLLPHVRLNKEMTFVSGVNVPEKLCMKFHTCHHIFKSGQNKGNCCSKIAYFDVEGCYCTTHRTFALKKKPLASTIINTTSVNKNVNTVIESPTLCKGILKSGKRAGQVCGSKIKCKNDSFCKRHLPK